MVHNVHQPFNKSKPNFIRANKEAILAGVPPKSRIDPEARANNPHYALVYGKLDDELKIDNNDDDKKRTINDKDFFGAIVDAPKTKDQAEARARKLKNVLDANIVLNTRKPMQVAVEGCGSLSKLSRIVSGVSLGLADKY